MGFHRIIGIGVVVAVLVGAAFAAGVAAGEKDNRKFVAVLSGAEEVPARDTQAHGLAHFRLIEDGTMIAFKLKVANIQNVFGAHIHCAAEGVNGPIGVTLFGGPVGGGRFSGPLANGVIAAPDAGNACGWADLAAVISAMDAGATYVNVHTNDGVSPTNTGPGDFPGGEIRGQVQVQG